MFIMHSLMHLRKVYEHGDLNEQQKLKYLSETKLIADDCAVLEIQNRGADDHDEIQEHLLKIQEFATEYKVTIRDVQKNTRNRSLHSYIMR